ncbi:MAG: methylamine utilization protein [Pseudomonadota bacterium]
MRLAFHALGAFFASTAVAAPLELQLLDVDGKGVSATVVVLRSTDPARPLARPVQETMDQINRQFDPHVLVVPTGSKVTFPNKDTVQHQVYSFSPTKKFTLELYRGTPKPETFDIAGVVTLGCNIHDNMRAYIFVVDAQYFGRTDAGGSWKVPDVLPGIYTVQIWHPRARNMKPIIDQKITVTADEPRVMLHLATPLKLRPESEIPGNWDAY